MASRVFEHVVALIVLIQIVMIRAGIRAKLKANLIDDELEDLKSRLKEAQKCLKQKSAYTLTLGSLVATIGVTSGIMLPAVAFGTLATATFTLTPAVYKYVDDTVKIDADNMYFLLQAEDHQH